MLHVHQECGERKGEGEGDDGSDGAGFVFLGKSKVFCDGNTSAWISIMRRRGWRGGRELGELGLNLSDEVHVEACTHRFVSRIELSHKTVVSACRHRGRARGVGGLVFSAAVGPHE